jgi:hypothetical protein
MLALVLRLLTAAMALLGLVALPLATPTRAEPEWDPTTAIAAYTDAFNRHDLPAALALFDTFGSATDDHGRHFEGQAGLTEFLLASGINRPDVRIKTERLHVVANRAVWTVSCSCAPGATEVRMVINRGKISVFAVIPPAAAPNRRSGFSVDPGLLVGVLVALGVIGGAVALAMRRRVHRTLPERRHPQGSLLLALARARASRS